MSVIKISDLEKAALRDRRERIATIILAGLVTRHQSYYDYAVADAVDYADALIAALDRPKEEQT